MSYFDICLRYLLASLIMGHKGQEVTCRTMALISILLNGVGGLVRFILKEH